MNELLNNPTCLLGTFSILALVFLMPSPELEHFACHALALGRELFQGPWDCALSTPLCLLDALAGDDGEVALGNLESKGGPIRCTFVVGAGGGKDNEKKRTKKTKEMEEKGMLACGLGQLSHSFLSID